MARYLGETVPQDYLEYINNNLINGILATMDEDGYPRTAPITFIRCKTEKQLLLGIGGMTRMSDNIRRDGKLSLCLVEEGDLALSIRGKGKIIREPMECNKYMVVVSVQVEEVKSDTSPDSKVVRGIEIQPRTERGARFIEEVNRELDLMLQGE
jgi:hypothetical protein